MFRTSIRAMDLAINEEQSQMRKLNQALTEVDSIITGLGRMSSMDDVQRVLRHEVNRLEEERNHYKDMISGLNVSMRYYNAFEDSIVEYAEQTGRVSQRRATWQNVGLDSNIVNIISALII